MSSLICRVWPKEVDYILTGKQKSSQLGLASFLIRINSGKLFVTNEQKLSKLIYNIII